MLQITPNNISKDHSIIERYDMNSLQVWFLIPWVTMTQFKKCNKLTIILLIPETKPLLHT